MYTFLKHALIIECDCLTQNISYVSNDVSKCIAIYYFLNNIEYFECYYLLQNILRYLKKCIEYIECNHLLQNISRYLLKKRIEYIECNHLLQNVSSKSNVIICFKMYRNTF